MNELSGTQRLHSSPIRQPRQRFPPSIWIIERHSVRKGLLTDSMAHLRPGDAFNPCSPLKEKPWCSTLTTPWQLASSVLTGYFFVDREDKTLRPCMDYRGLDDIAVKKLHPLPLISSVEVAKIFSKLAYQLRPIREGNE